jgi:hypothetical protein
MDVLRTITSKLFRGVPGRTRQSGAKDFCPAPAFPGRDLENYFAQVAANYEAVSNSFWYYRQLVDELRDIPRLRIVPLQDLQGCSAQKTRVIGLRHDIDADPLTALRCARYLARQGIGGSFYLLHTAVYYGEFYGDVFVRTASLSDWIRGFIVAGCELGLHNDSLGVYAAHGHDGIAALRQEIEWFRAHGVRIRGTVAHNSGPIYGAENFEIFSGRALWQRDVATRDGRRLPLGMLNERDVGLTYEGSFAKPRRGIDPGRAAEFFADRGAADFGSQAWVRQYLLENPCCEWDLEVQFWLVGKDRWIIAGRAGGDTIFDWHVGMAQVLDRLKALPDGSRSVLVIHPECVRGGG